MIVEAYLRDKYFLPRRDFYPHWKNVQVTLFKMSLESYSRKLVALIEFLSSKLTHCYRFLRI